MYTWLNLSPRFTYMLMSPRHFEEEEFFWSEPTFGQIWIKSNIRRCINKNKWTHSSSFFAVKQKERTLAFYISLHVALNLQVSEQCARCERFSPIFQKDKGSPWTQNNVPMHICAKKGQSCFSPFCSTCELNRGTFLPHAKLHANNSRMWGRYAQLTPQTNYTLTPLCCFHYCNTFSQWASGIMSSQCLQHMHATKTEEEEDDAGGGSEWGWILSKVRQGPKTTGSVDIDGKMISLDLLPQ